MPLSKPEDVEDGPEPPEPNEIPEDEKPMGEREVEAPWGDELPLEDALDGVWEVAASEDMHDAQMDERLARIEERVEEIESVSVEMQRVLEILASQADYVEAECEDCGGQLEEKTQLMGKNHVRCVDCEDVKAVER